ncbi:efflux RND transporter permease subunit [Cohnella thailandensis]|uniref:Efflux RND transporter permease subunit n=1 Tax=Cohnella thailandensis TaxID=557557 RepID=A0A841T658_9BACL|nr:efflux RND transporter permease subunit [Cohnella thailandensis]MBB6638429.1 efflux RND transporter permease subunit [Cohnella thailandensis]MBP1977093.1 HAE1 family hydrophobic/amphiphilic exporter-1 [Cohnella thailandensis]
MNFLSRLSLKNGVAVVILCVLVLGYGLYSATQIKQQTFPDLELPAVAISVVQPGASSEEIESSLTNPIEDTLKSFKGYDSLTSSTTENGASLFIQFPFGTDMEKMSADVETALAKLALPDNASVTVQRLSAGSVPVYQAAVFSEGDGPDSDALAAKLNDEIVPKLQKLEGVSSVTLDGTKTEKVNIVVDKEKANRYGISLGSIQTAIQSLDYAVPLGNVSQDETTIPVRLVGSIDSLDQIRNIGIVGSAAGQAAQGGMPAAVKVKLSDIATVTTVSSQDSITRYNGTPSYVIGVVKNQDANTADVADEVKEVLNDYQDKGELDLHVIQDQGEAIEESISSLVREGLFGALFCVIIIFLFLRNVRATIISILSLPISIFATIAVMDQMGYTLNIMTLGGIAVSVGRIVDDSIVVIENIFRWRQEKGKGMNGKELAFKATKEVIGAVASSTIATVVVFLPLAFVSGIIGEFFRPFSIAVVVSILSSLLVAVMLIPVLGAKFFKNVKPHKEGKGVLARSFEKVITGALKRKAIVLAASVALLVASLCTIPALGVAFLPADSVPTASIEVTLPAQSSQDQTNKVAEQIEDYVAKLEGMSNYQVSIGGGGSGNPFGGGAAQNNKATVTVQFSDDSDVERTVEQANIDLPALANAAVEGTTVTAKEGEQQGLPSGSGIDVTLYSGNVEHLSQAAKQVEQLMSSHADLKDTDNNMNDVSPKWVLTLNEKGIDSGVSAMAVMQAVNEQLKPVDAGTYALDNKNQDVTISYAQRIGSREELENIAIPTAAGMLTLKDIANVDVQNALATINHDDGKTYAEVSATIKDGADTAAVTNQVKKDIQSLALPSDVEISFGGGLAMIAEGFASIGIAMAVAVGLVFLVMSMTFGGIVTPLIILSSLIFIPVGSLTALLITGQALSMSAMIGMLMLVGIVVTNAVVLLDRVEKNRRSGMAITDAIIEASTTRLRPILMTAFATMLALMPLALSGSSTSLISGGLAITVIGGLFTSTLLTLVVVPVVYELAWKKRKVREIEDF